MRIVFSVVALSFSVGAYAQVTRDANPRDKQNTEGANTDARAYDPATKVRVRTEGSAGGVQGGIKTDEQTEMRGNASRGRGRPTRSSRGLEKKGEGRVHDENSSDREKGRGAWGAIR